MNERWRREPKNGCIKKKLHDEHRKDEKLDAQKCEIYVLKRASKNIDENCTNEDINKRKWVNCK